MEETTLSFEAFPGLQNSSQIYDAEYDIPSRFQGSSPSAVGRSTQQKDLQRHNKNRIVCDRSLLAWITIDRNSGRRIAEDGIHSGPVTASSHIPAMRLCERKWKS